MADNYFVIHVAEEYDYLFIGERKTEFLTGVASEYKRMRGKDLPIAFADKIKMKLKSGKTQTLTFVSDSSIDGVSYSGVTDAVEVRVGKHDLVSDKMFETMQVYQMKKTEGPKTVTKRIYAPVPLAKMRGPAMKNVRVLLETEALQEYAPDDARCLTLTKGCKIKIFAKSEDGWWPGEVDGKVGYLPETFLKDKGGDA
jgi:hypothetical protein